MLIPLLLLFVVSCVGVARGGASRGGASAIVVAVVDTGALVGVECWCC